MESEPLTKNETSLITPAAENKTTSPEGFTTLNLGGQHSVRYEWRRRGISQAKCIWGALVFLDCRPIDDQFHYLFE